jgi:hypothetical protein
MAQHDKSEANAAPAEDGANGAQAAKTVSAKAAADGIQAQLALLSQTRGVLKSAPTGESVKKLAQHAYAIASSSAKQDIPFVGQVAASLVELCQSAPDPASLPLALVEAHIDAVRAIVSAGIKDGGDPTGSALVHELHSGVEKMVKAWQTPASRAG